MSNKARISPVEPAPTPFHRLTQALNPTDRPWACSADGFRLILPHGLDHARRITERAGKKIAAGWDGVVVVPWSPAVDISRVAAAAKTVVVAVPAFLWTPAFTKFVDAQENVGIYRLKRTSVRGHVRTELSEVQKGFLTVKASKLLTRGGNVHYIE